MFNLGFFFNDYESAGSGISKYAPKKKGIKLFFELFFRKFWKFFELNMLYSVFFLPIVLALLAVANIKNTVLSMGIGLILLLTFAVTIGPATAGVVKILRKYVIEKHSFIFADFVSGFKDNFKKSSIIGFIDSVVLLSIYAGLQVYPALAIGLDNKLLYAPLVLSLSFAIVIAMMNFYIFPMMIATDISFKNLIKNSFALAFFEIKKSIITFFIVVAVTAFFVVIPLCVDMRFLIFLVFFPAAIVWFIICFNCYPVIQKYVINPYYTNMGQVNPELMTDDPEGDAPIFEDMGGKEKPIEKRKKSKGKRIS